MQDLRLVGVHDDGTHLLLEDADGTRLRLPLDDALRAAVRQDRSRLGQLQIELDGGLRPRDVQALVRAGASADDVAARAGWTVEKVRRYEGPILAERAHVADLARQVRMRTRASGSDAPTLTTRVGERMRARDVDPTTSTWDSWRDAEAQHWTVAMRFVAGGRERRALWSFELATQTVTPLDDEARWLTEEETPDSSGPIPGPTPATRVQTSVYDVEAEGGVAATASRPADGSVDLVTAMRERSQARGRRSRRGRTPTDVPEPPTDALPI
ncbi:MAG: septation protein SepH, partial [Actinomycetota bacterium]|nr:septation protein SepH [Actinomycetota bacterium]